MKNYFSDDVLEEDHINEVLVMISLEKFGDEVISHPFSTVEMTGDKQWTQKVNLHTPTMSGLYLLLFIDYTFSLY